MSVAFQNAVRLLKTRSAELANLPAARREEVVAAELAPLLPQMEAAEAVVATNLLFDLTPQHAAVDFVIDNPQAVESFVKTAELARGFRLDNVAKQPLPLDAERGHLDTLRARHDVDLLLKQLSRPNPPALESAWAVGGAAFGTVVRAAAEHLLSLSQQPAADATWLRGALSGRAGADALVRNIEDATKVRERALASGAPQKTEAPVAEQPPPFSYRRSTGPSGQYVLDRTHGLPKLQLQSRYGPTGPNPTSQARHEVAVATSNTLALQGRAEALIELADQAQTADEQAGLLKDAADHANMALDEVMDAVVRATADTQPALAGIVERTRRRTEDLLKSLGDRIGRLSDPPVETRPYLLQQLSIAEQALGKAQQADGDGPDRWDAAAKVGRLERQIEDELSTARGQVPTRVAGSARDWLRKNLGELSAPPAALKPQLDPAQRHQLREQAIQQTTLGVERVAQRFPFLRPAAKIDEQELAALSPRELITRLLDLPPSLVQRALAKTEAGYPNDDAVDMANKFEKIVQELNTLTARAGQLQQDGSGHLPVDEKAPAKGDRLAAFEAEATELHAKYSAFLERLFPEIRLGEALTSQDVLDVLRTHESPDDGPGD